MKFTGSQNKITLGKKNWVKKKDCECNRQITAESGDTVSQQLTDAHEDSAQVCFKFEMGCNGNPYLE